MIKYSFCESVHVTGAGRWHIRRLTDKGRKLGGGIDTPSLCKRVNAGWDVKVEITEFHLENSTCAECREIYLKETS